jgi:hypothetical protein
MSITSVTVPVLAVLAAVALVAPAAASGQESGTFTLTQGETVVATESFTRSADALDTELEVVGQARMTTHAALHTDATISRVEIRVFAPGQEEAGPTQTSAADFSDGMLRLEQPIGTPAAEPSPVAEGAVPYLNPSPSYMEQILRRARALGGETSTVQVWVPGPGGGQVVQAQVAFHGTTATLGLGAVEIEIQTDDAGRLLAASVPSQSLEIVRE